MDKCRDQVENDGIWTLLPLIFRITKNKHNPQEIVDHVCRQLVTSSEIVNVSAILKGRFGELSTFHMPTEESCTTTKIDLSSGAAVPKCISQLPYKDDYTVRHRSNMFLVDPCDCHHCGLNSLMDSQNTKTAETHVTELIHGNRLRGWLCISLPVGLTRQMELFLKSLSDFMALVIDREMILAEYNLMERQFRRVLENTSDAVIGFNLDYQITFINSGTVKMFEYSASELVGEPLELIVPVHERSDFRYYLKKIDPGGVISVQEIKCGKKSGELLEIELTSWQELNQMGTPIGYISILRDISLERQAVTALKESEQRFKTLYENIPGGMLIIGQDYVIADVNSRTCEITGYSRDELIGQFCDIVCPKGKLSRLCPIWEEGNLEFSGMDTAIKCKDSTKKPIIKNAKRIMIQGKKYILENFQDVTELKATETALRESESKYRLLADNTLDCIWVMDLNLNFVYLNPAVEKLFGYTPEEVVNTHVSQYTVAREIDTLKSILRKNEAFHFNDRIMLFETELKHKNGQLVPIEVTLRVLYDEQGKPERIQGTTREISQRKAIEKERERFIAAIDQSGEIILISDTSGRVQYVNPAFETITGFERGEVIGRIQRLFRQSFHDPSTYKSLMETIKSGRSWQGTVRNRRKDNSDYIEDVAISPVFNEQGEIEHYISVIRDVTHERELEEQLRHSQKMEAVGELAGGVAHDFNNLLQVITGYLELVRDDLVDDNTTRDSIGEIESACDRAKSLVSQMLAFSRRQLLRPQNLNLNRVIEGVMNMLSRVIPESVSLEFTAGKQIGTISADPGMIEQVLLNLVLNSKDAMPNGGTIKLETRNIHLDSEYSTGISTAVPGKYVQLTVTDDGFGMTEHVRERIFEPFFTTKSVGQGTGLGLSMVYGLIKQHKGIIEVFSEVDAGSTFRIYLPVVASQVLYEDTQQKMEIQSGQETILVAEDDEIVRKLTVAILTRAGYSVLTAADGEDALSVFTHNKDSIDLVVLDVIMPLMNGKEVSDRIAEINPDMPVLFASGYNDTEIQTNFVINQDVTLIQKPYTRERLLHCVRQLLDKNQV